MKIKELTDKQDKRLSYISQHSKSKRIREKALKRLMGGSFNGTFNPWIWRKMR